MTVGTTAVVANINYPISNILFHSSGLRHREVGDSAGSLSPDRRVLRGGSRVGTSGASSSSRRMRSEGKSYYNDAQECSGT